MTQDRAKGTAIKLPMSWNDDLGERLDLQSGHVLIGDLPRMLHYLRGAEALATRLGDERRLARVLCHMAVCFWWTGQIESAIDYSRRALAIAGNLPDSSLQILARGRLGLAYSALGEYRQAIETIEESLKALSGDLAGDRFEMAALPAASGRVYLAACLAHLGEFTAAAAAAAGAVEIALRVDHPYSVALAYFGAGRWRAVQGNFGEALPWLERGLDYCRREGVYAFSLFAAWTGIAYAHAGRLSEAIALLEEAAEYAEALKFKVYRPRILAFLAQAYLLSGLLDDARQQARRALDLSLADKQRAIEADALRVLAEIHALHDPPETADAAHGFGRALALAEERGMRPLVARCHLGLGKLYRSTGKLAEAQQELSLAAEMLRSMEMAFWLEQVEAELHGLTQVDVATRP